MPLFGKTDALASAPKSLNLGRILAINVLTGGSGYTNGATATVTITGGGGTGATATALVSGGIVQSVTITSPGTGYTTTPTLSIPGASNATFLIKLEPVVSTAKGYTVSNIVYVDDTEAALATNKSKGIHSPGWWKVAQRENSLGEMRYYAELLVAHTSVTAAVGDMEEDLVVPDVESVASISVQPTNQTSVAGAATFTVTAAISGGGAITYQWQKAAAATPTVFVDVAGKTTASCVLSGQLVGNNGDKYRVLVAGGGAKVLASSAATLTFGS